MIILGEGLYLCKIGVLKNQDYIVIKLYHNFNHKKQGDELTDDDYKACIITVRLTPTFCLTLGKNLIKAWYTKVRGKK